MNFFYVYILQSESNPQCFYTGITEDLKGRLIKHNAGEVPHTAKARPWRIKTAVAFTDNNQAHAFERYLKTASGRAFAKKAVLTQKLKTLLSGAYSSILIASGVHSQLGVVH